MLRNKLQLLTHSARHSQIKTQITSEGDSTHDIKRQTSANQTWAICFFPPAFKLCCSYLQTCHQKVKELLFKKNPIILFISLTLDDSPTSLNRPLINRKRKYSRSTKQWLEFKNQKNADSLFELVDNQFVWHAHGINIFSKIKYKQ